MTRILVFLLVLLVAILAFAQFLRRTGMFFPDKHPAGRWNVNDWVVTPTEHVFAAGGLQLHAWWFRANDPGAPTLIWFHGNAGNLTDRAEMCAELAKRGISVFIFDYRGFGRSGGRVSENGTFDDSLAAYDYVHGNTPNDIVLYGESIGGPYAAYVAKERKPVRAVILENSFPSLRELGNAIYKPLPLGWTAPFAMRTTAWLNEAGVPVLVMHGQRDAVIPYALGRKLFDGLRVPKEMLTSHAGHCEIPLFEADRYYETVTRFIRKGPA
ncbi:MAG TPA: alpha/beta fold hydrolase [Thermoanaerobaculia bacterium]